MEAPDKIYIKPYITTIMSGGLWSCEPTELATVPYIRKDMLLEWAKELEQKRLMGYIMFDELINKLEQL